MTEPATPSATRPFMPGYGVTDGGEGLLRWSWAEQRLTTSHDYWVATVWPDGRPHVTPVWGLWLEAAFWFSCAPRSRKAKNLTQERRVTITTDAARQPVILDGVAEFVVDDVDALTGFAAATNAKYEGDYSVEFFAANALIRVRPRSVFALDDADFTATPTRWTFVSP